MVVDLVVVKGVYWLRVREGVDLVVVREVVVEDCGEVSQGLSPPHKEQWCVGKIYAPPENEEGLVGQSVAPPQRRTLYVLRSECGECDERMKRKGSICVYLWEEVVVVQVGQAPEE